MDNIKDQLTHIYNLKKDFMEDKWSVWEFLSCDVFDLTTYDEDMDELFVKAIIEVLRVIINKETFEYIRDENNYIKYLIVCNLLYNFEWIEWGTSIRGAWIECEENSKIICSHFQSTFGGTQKIDIKIPATKENIIALVEWAESEVEKAMNGE